MKLIVMEFIVEALLSCTNNTAGNVITSVHVSLLHYNVAIAGRRPKPAAGRRRRWAYDYLYTLWAAGT